MFNSSKQKTKCLGNPFLNMGFIKFWFLSILFFTFFPLSLIFMIIIIGPTKTKLFISALIKDFIQTLVIFLFFLGFLIWLILEFFNIFL